MTQLRQKLNEKRINVEAFVKEHRTKWSKDKCVTCTRCMVSCISIISLICLILGLIAYPTSQQYFVCNYKVNWDGMFHPMTIEALVTVQNNNYYSIKASNLSFKVFHQDTMLVDFRPKSSSKYYVPILSVADFWESVAVDVDMVQA
eukprot:138387_1